MEMKAPATVAELRALITSSKNARIIPVPDVPFGNDFRTLHIRHPTIAIREKLITLIGDSKTVNAKTHTELFAYAIVSCLCTENGELVYDSGNKHDMPALMAQLREQSTEWTDKVTAAVIATLNGPTAEICKEPVDGDKICGTALQRGARFCHVCGKQTPAPLEVAKGN